VPGYRVADTFQYTDYSLFCVSFFLFMKVHLSMLRGRKRRINTCWTYIRLGVYFKNLARVKFINDKTGILDTEQTWFFYLQSLLDLNHRLFNLNRPNALFYLKVWERPNMTTFCEIT
jgi:hypothetical protein